MAVIDMVACGLIEIDDGNFKTMRREVRAELKEKGFRLCTGTSASTNATRRAEERSTQGCISARSWSAARSWSSA
jgi:hypothetical protein